MVWDKLGGIRRSPLDRPRRQRAQAAPAQNGGAFSTLPSPASQWQQPQTAPSGGAYSPYAQTRPGPQYQNASSMSTFSPWSGQSVQQQSFGSPHAPAPQQPATTWASPGRAQPIPPQSYGTPYGMESQQAYLAQPGGLPPVPDQFAASASSQGPAFSAVPPDPTAAKPQTLQQWEAMYGNFMDPQSTYMSLSNRDKAMAYSQYKNLRQQSEDAARSREAASPHGQMQASNKAAMRQKAMDINTARGELYKMMAKREAMGAGMYSKAGLDLQGEIDAFQEGMSQEFGRPIF